MSNHTPSLSVWQEASKPITMTAAAIEHVRRQIRQQIRQQARQQSGQQTDHDATTHKTAEHTYLGIRLGTKKMGCSGYAYDISIITHTEPDDQISQITADILVAVAPKDLPFVQGTAIDYVKIGLNQQLQFTNPNEKASCGCGESFSITDTGDFGE